MAHGGYVYIASNKYRSVFYIGVTFNLSARSWEHKNHQGSSFTKKYNCVDLVYFEFFEGIEEAIAREKKLKKWNRAWKIELIKKKNPNMNDLYEEVRDFE